MSRLSPDFYTRNDVLTISKELLGKVIVTRFDGILTSGMIVETEAYRGPEDRASHAWNNRYTARTKTMFEKGGKAYIYRCYGIHHLFNVVTAGEGVPHAVLIRAIAPLDNIEAMLERRKFESLRPQLTMGPGTLSMALGLTTTHNGADLNDPDSPVWIEDRGVLIPASDIVATTRVGVDYAGEAALWEWRFYIRGVAYVSKKVKGLLP